MSTPSRLEIRQLSSRFGGPFDLSVAAGECIGIRGRSGAGKSVFLRLVADLDPGTGEVLLEGKARSAMPAPGWRRRVVYQAAEPAWWHATPREHLDEATPSAELARWLDSLGLDTDILDADVTRLSTGERQRLALLRSLSRRPSVLLLDEPSAALDPTSTLALEALLRDRLAAGLSILLVTHSDEQADRLSTRQWRIVDGRLVPA